MLRKIVDITNVTITVLTGAFLMLMVLCAIVGIRLIPEDPVASWGWGLLILFIGFALVGMNGKLLLNEYREGGFSFKNNIRITTEQGTTEFSIPSMELLILRDLKAQPDIVDPTVSLRSRGEGKPMRCDVQLKLHRQEDVVKRVDAIKKQVRDIVDRLIPGGLTVEVLVEVRDFVSESMRGAGRPELGVFDSAVHADDGEMESV